jgi:hypothetical protein
VEDEEWSCMNVIRDSLATALMNRSWQFVCWIAMLLWLYYEKYGCNKRDKLLWPKWFLFTFVDDNMWMTNDEYIFCFILMVAEQVSEQV